MNDQRIAARTLGPEAAEGVLGCVILHGFTGSTWDVLPVASGLAARGHAVSVPVLRGHDGGPQGVREATLSDWRADVDASIDALYQATGAPVLVGGLSMGGLLALDVALRRPDVVAGVASMAAPLRLSAMAMGLASLASNRRTRFARNLIWPKIGGSDISTGERLPGPAGVPARALAELGRLMGQVEGEIHRFSTPLLVLHAVGDHTASLDAAYTIASRADAPFLRVVVLEDGYHVITRDRPMKRVAAEVAEFADRLAGRGQRRGVARRGLP